MNGSPSNALFRHLEIGHTRRSVELALVFAMAVGAANVQAMAGVSPDTLNTSIPAKTWAQDASAREVEIILHTGSYLRYHQRTINAKGDELRDVVESKDGAVARLVMRDNRPLTPEEDQAERDRLAALIGDPAEFAKHVKNDANGKKMAIDLIRLMPDAMTYTYAADQTPSSAGSASQVVIDYTPDPKFNPPTTVSQALSGLRGRIWIDTRSKNIVRMTGEIFLGVNFGWGMLAHIYPGGTIDVEQAEALGDRWNMTNFHQHVAVKALMVKTIKVNTEVHSLDFQQVPGELSYQQAIRLLLDTPLPK